VSLRAQRVCGVAIQLGAKRDSSCRGDEDGAVETQRRRCGGALDDYAQQIRVVKQGSFVIGPRNRGVKVDPTCAVNQSRFNRLRLGTTVILSLGLERS
jgi:hypothetical protein